MAPVEWHHADGVAGRHHLAGGLIDEHEGKNAVEILDEARSSFFKKMNEDLAVGRRWRSRLTSDTTLGRRLSPDSGLFRTVRIPHIGDSRVLERFRVRG